MSVDEAIDAVVHFRRGPGGDRSGVPPEVSRLMGGIAVRVVVERRCHAAGPFGRRLRTLVQLGSQVSGNIQKLFADFNSQVKAGQVVAQIDPALFQATVTQAEGDVANAQAALELAKPQ